ncbi:MAG TPA: peptidoglycan bridge formation glycyltransferase FemA/FemB family protein [Bryobacteraceae bacterium]|nr:peptidoglycan bridge formation glycyltransferase FemA/FemB family protein [Bryobacteraceae bacterium]
MSSTASAPDKWAAWDDFLEGVDDTGFMQSLAWSDFRGAHGAEYFGAVLKARGVTLGGAIVQKCSTSDDDCFYYVQDGPVLPDDEGVAEQIFTAFIEHVNLQRAGERQIVSHLRIEPRWHRLPSFVSGFRPAPEDDDYTEPRRTLCVDLSQDAAAILAQMKPKGRYNVRLAAKHGVTVLQDSSDRGLSDFYQIYSDTAERQAIDLKPFEYFETLTSMFSRRHKLAIFFAEYQHERIATALVLYFGRRATYFFGGSRYTHRSLMAPYLLHYEAMQAARSEGCRWYDFWGIAPEGNVDDAWYDISVFKRKFGGVEVELVPTLDYVYDEQAYVRYLHSQDEDG